jgi:hypothetical protein
VQRRRQQQQQQQQQQKVIVPSGGWRRYLQDLQQKHGIPGFVDFVEGLYGLPCVK